MNQSTTPSCVSNVCDLKCNEGYESNSSKGAMPLDEGAETYRRASER